MGSFKGAETPHSCHDMGVAPGFIDTHTHTEVVLLLDPSPARSLRQGITTAIMGLDGMSIAPFSAENYRLCRHCLDGMLGNMVQDMDMSSIAVFRSEQIIQRMTQTPPDRSDSKRGAGSRKVIITYDHLGHLLRSALGLGFDYLLYGQIQTIRDERVGSPESSIPGGFCGQHVLLLH